MQRVGLVAAVLALPCIGGAAIVAALDGEAERVDPPAAAQQLAGDADAATPAAASETPTSSSPSPVKAAPVVTKRIVTARQAIPYTTRTVKDADLAEGEKRVRTKGVAGVRTLSYEVTLSGGTQTGRRLVGSVVTRKPVTKVVAVGTRADSGGGCDPNYTPCVPVASDVDCAGGGGNGPAYVDGPIRVIGGDPYDLDRDGDGIACD